MVCALRPFEFFSRDFCTDLVKGFVSLPSDMLIESAYLFWIILHNYMEVCYTVEYDYKVYYLLHYITVVGVAFTKDS